MYPTSPTVEQWRLAAAKLARANGVPVPEDFDGTMAAIQRLNTDGKTDINAAITWMQNAYVVQNPGLFPQANIDYAKNFIAKNPSASAWAGGFTQLENGLLTQAGDFAVQYGKELFTAVTDPVQAYRDVKNAITGPAAVKEDPKGFATVVITGVIVGAGLWWGWKHFAKKGAQ